MGRSSRARLGAGSPRRFNALRGEELLVLAVLVGVALRLHQLGSQVIADDEWHALDLLGSQRSYPFRSILMHFGTDDVCIPLTLYYKLASVTVGISEWVVRMPSLAAGLASLVVFPLLIRPLHGRRVATIFAWLLAVSPMHVYVSRNARPYAIALFLTFVALMAFHSCWTTSGSRARWRYVVCAVLAPYFHLTTLPVVLFPLVLAFAARLVRISRAGDRMSNRALIGTASALAGGLLLLLGPPLLSDWTAIHDKVTSQPLNLYSFWGALELMIRAGRLYLATLGLALVGMIVLYRRDRLLALSLGVLLMIPFAVVIAFHPLGMTDPIVNARYALVCLPLLLWLVAVGLVVIGRRLRTVFPPAGVLTPAAWLLATGLSSPLVRNEYTPNNWTNHAIFQYYLDMNPGENVHLRTAHAALMLKILQAPVSPFYTELGRLPPMSLNLLEAPWFYQWQFNPFPIYQRVHHQQDFVGFVDDRTNPARLGEVPLSDGRFNFRRFVHVLDEKDLCAKHIDLVLFHKDLAKEVEATPLLTRPRMVPKLIAYYVAHYGRPAYDDPTLAVFDMRGPCGRR
jgi:hypothetical protein